MEIFIYTFYFFFFYFGAIMGSFLNVISFELEANVFDKEVGKSFWERINRRSHCNTCNHQLGFLDLFPIFSYIFAGGKCRHCKAKFSSRYLWVEIFSGIAFMGIFYKIFNGFFDMNFLINFISLTTILSGLILIFLFDLKHKIIPDLVIYPLFFISLIFLFFTNNLDFTILWQAGLTALPFWGLWFISQGRLIGFADWKLIFLLGLFLNSFEQLYSFAILSFWYGAIYALPLIWLSKKYKMSSEVAFGPFIILSFWTVYIFDVNILEWTGRIMNLFN